MPTLEQRFWDKVHVPDSDVWEDECWPWTASHRRSGHGQVGIYRPGGNTTLAAHRMAYELVNGSIDDRLVLHHECENPGCCNPDHLTVMTRAGHTSHHRASETCKRGHPLVGGRCKFCKAMNKKARRRMGLE